MNIFHVYKNGVFVKQVDANGKYDALNMLLDWGTEDRLAPIDNVIEEAQDILKVVIGHDTYKAVLVDLAGWPMPLVHPLDYILIAKKEDAMKFDGHRYQHRIKGLFRHRKTEAIPEGYEEVWMVNGHRVHDSMGYLKLRYGCLKRL